MTEQFDLGPATRQMGSLLAGVTDDQLTAPTPCEDYTLGDLIDHVDGLSYAFAAAARKDLGSGTSQPPVGDASRLSDDWRTRIPRQLDALADAWQSPDAWEGMTRAGGVDLPGVVAGRVAMNEVVLHGWDIARASGQPFDCDPETLEACLEFVSQMSGPEHEGDREGLFGPVVPVPANAPRLDHVLGLSGRDPAWPAR